MSEAPQRIIPQAAGSDAGDVLASIRRMIAHGAAPAALAAPPSGILRLEAAIGAEPATVHRGGSEAGAAVLDWALPDLSKAPAGPKPGPMLVSAGEEAETLAEPVALASVLEPGRFDTANGGDSGNAAATPGDAAPAYLVPAPSGAALPFPDHAGGASSDLAAPEPASMLSQIEPQDSDMSLHSLPLEPGKAAPSTDTTVADPSASLVASIIRDVIRQELAADASGRMGRELREIILREVARAIIAPEAASR